MAKYTDASTQKEGYNIIHDLLSSSTTMKQLTEAVEKSIPIIQEYKLDDYQKQKLEEYGTRRYEQIKMSIDRMAFDASRNKFKR